ncbi:hypothetical protein BCEP4_70097 [Burkholderia cepacia]|nr:hypothetical protein BCEP4_70097 [Burkholderia cepacia]
MAPVVCSPDSLVAQAPTRTCCKHDWKVKGAKILRAFAPSRPRAFISNRYEEPEIITEQILRARRRATYGQSFIPD